MLKNTILEEFKLLNNILYDTYKIELALNKASEFSFTKVTNINACY